MKDDDLTIDALAESGAFDPLLEELKNTRRGSRFVSPDSSPAYVRHIAAGGTADDWQGKAGRRVVEPPTGLGGRSSGVEFLRDVRALRRGDLGAFERIRRSAKAITDGEFLVAVETLPSYVAARRAAGPVRDLCTEFDVQSREIRLLLEGDPLEVDWTAEGGLKPSSDASVIEKIALIFKPAGVTTVPDELLDDSDGLAEQIVSNSFGSAIGRKIDEALLDGDGVGKPTGVLRAVGVNHVSAIAQDAVTLFEAVQGALARLRAKFYEASAVVLRPEIALRFSVARSTATDELLFPGGVAEAFAPTRCVYDANLPTDAGGLSSIVVADWRQLYVLSRGGLIIESSPYPAFESDVTTLRAYERIGAAVTQPAAFEVIDDVDITP